MRPIILGGVIAAGLVGAFFLGANYETPTNPGPAEQLGEKIDRGLNEAARAVEKGADDIQERTQ